MDSNVSTHMFMMAGSDWVKAQHVPARLWPATRPCHHPHLLGAEGCVQLFFLGKGHCFRYFDRGGNVNSFKGYVVRMSEKNKVEDHISRILFKNSVLVCQ